MELKSLEDVRNVEWVGNFHWDQPTFKAIYTFAYNQYQLGNREIAHQALLISAIDGMGLREEEQPTINDLEQFAADFEELWLKD